MEREEKLERQRSIRLKQPFTFARFVFWFAGIIGILFVVVIIVQVLETNSDTRDTSTRLMDSCKREFGSDQHAVDSCFIRLGLRRLNENEKERLDRANRGAR